MPKITLSDINVNIGCGVSENVPPNYFEKAVVGDVPPLASSPATPIVIPLDNNEQVAGRD